MKEAAGEVGEVARAQWCGLSLFEVNLGGGVCGR